MNTRFRNRKYLFILIPITLIFAISAVVMLLWNQLLPELLGSKQITYWQAMGVFVLSKILFGNFGFQNKRKPPFAKDQLNKGWMHLKKCEKEKFKEEWEKRTCTDKS